MKGTEVLAIIPARGGSQGVPQKNVREAGGRPLIAWTCAAAKASASVNRVIVSTDDVGIAAVARKHGAEQPFLRPADLAHSKSSGMDVLLHALEWLDANEGYRPDKVVYLQPTSPLRTSEDIEAALALLRAKNASGVVSVTPTHHHPFWIKKIGEGGRLANFLDSTPEIPNRQQLPPAFALNGALYAYDRAAVLRDRSWFPDPTLGYVMPPERSLDVDTPFDLHLVDLLLREKAYS